MFIIQIYPFPEQACKAPPFHSGDRTYRDGSLFPKNRLNALCTLVGTNLCTTGPPHGLLQVAVSEVSRELHVFQKPSEHGQGWQTQLDALL